MQMSSKQENSPSRQRYVKEESKNQSPFKIRKIKPGDGTNQLNSAHMEEAKVENDRESKDETPFDDQVATRSDDESDEDFDNQLQNVNVFENIQEKFFDILENEEVEDVFDLNEKFLSQQLGVEQEELALLPKIELRVDTRFHNLQVTGEILPSLEYLKLNDSII